MSKKEAMQKFHKDIILNAAGRLFEHNGFDKTTMDDIAREADYSKATLYVYFKSKDEILYTLIYNAMRMLLGKIEAGISSSEHAMDQYKAICEELVSFSEEHPFYYKSLTQTIKTDMKSRAEVPILNEIYLVGEQINTKIEAVLCTGIKQGCFKEDMQSLPTGFLYWGALSSVIQLADSKAEYILQKMGMDKRTFLDFSFSTLLRMILKEDVSENRN